LVPILPPTPMVIEPVLVSANMPSTLWPMMSPPT
jgi:hypothetical protein